MNIRHPSCVVYSAHPVCDVGIVGSSVPRSECMTPDVQLLMCWVLQQHTGAYQSLRASITTVSSFKEGTSQRTASMFAAGRPHMLGLATPAAYSRCMLGKHAFRGRHVVLRAIWSPSCGAAVRCVLVLPWQLAAVSVSVVAAHLPPCNESDHI